MYGIYTYTKHLELYKIATYSLTSPTEFTVLTDWSHKNKQTNRQVTIINSTHVHVTTPVTWEVFWMVVYCENNRQARSDALGVCVCVCSSTGNLYCSDTWSTKEHRWEHSWGFIFSPETWRSWKNHKCKQPLKPQVSRRGRFTHTKQQQQQQSTVTSGVFWANFPKISTQHWGWMQTTCYSYKILF